MAREPVPEADRLEQEMPPDPGSPTTRGIPVARGHPFEAPEADVIEQELPLAKSTGSPGIDAERSEPISDADRADRAESPGWGSVEDDGRAGGGRRP